MASDRPIIYHNPACSKSRETLQILEDNTTSPEIIEYLENPPGADELRRIVALLGIPARDLLRSGEAAYADAGLDDGNLDDDNVIRAICEFPILLQRPIVISGKRAVIGRPPSRVLEILA
jgi:arsenate reductase